MESNKASIYEVKYLLSLRVRQPNQLPLRILHLWRAAPWSVPQPVLVNPRYAADAPGEADGGGAGVAACLEETSSAQLGEHAGLALDAPGLAAQGAFLPGLVAAAVGVALGEDAFLLAAAQVLGDLAGEFAALVGLQAGDERGEPGLQVVLELSHGGCTRCRAPVIRCPVAARRGG